VGVYIHSPGNGPMKGEDKQPRYEYPGQINFYEDGTPISKSRLFIGDCLPQYPNSAVWFRNEMGLDKQWHPSVYVAQVVRDSLYGFLASDSTLPVSAAVVDGNKCREIPGEDQSSEP